MTARAIMIQGTASSVGKSLLTAALCRLFSRAGLRVVPFKSQNMALNAAVVQGGEIGRAQAMQAEAAGVEPSVDMNPILLKPERDNRSQVVVLGRPAGSMSAVEYYARRSEHEAIIAGAYDRLRRRADLVVIEGAGSPAEVNLKQHDIVNMHVARMANAPVLLVGDIDRGGVFAALVGTLELLDPDERSRVAGFIINRFRGDRSLLASGLEFLESRTGVPVLGVVPYVHALRVAEEDSVPLDDRQEREAGRDAIEIAVVRLPHISNADDFVPLAHEPGVVVRYLSRAEQVERADLVILPGSKSTASDLAWLRGSGIASAIEERAAHGRPILGICGGCQMLGVEILDPLGVESPQERTRGLGLLPLATRFAPEKVTARVRARVASASFLGPAGTDIDGYEIHMGEVERVDGAAPAFELLSREGMRCGAFDGAVRADGVVVGTLVHGLFEDDAVRAHLIEWLRARRGISAPRGPRIPTREAEYDRLARAVAGAIDWALLCRIVGVEVAPPFGAIARTAPAPAG